MTRKHKYTSEEVDTMLKKTNILASEQFKWNITNYVSMNTNLPFICKKCGKEFKRQPTVFIHRNATCPYCNGKPRNIPYTTEEFIEKSKNIFQRNDWSYEKTTYKGNDKKVGINCHKQDEFGKEHGMFYVTPHAHIGKMHSGCPKCSGKYGGQERFEKLVEQKYGKYYDLSKTIYKTALTPITVICPVHGEFKTKPNWMLSDRGCPYCSSSNVEIEIKSMLDKENINYEYKARNKQLPFLDGLEIDFFIPSKSIAIECQGIQHFKPINFFGGKEKYEEQIKRDEKKKLLCEQNNIKLLYYSNLKIDFPYEVYTNKETLLNYIKNYGNS